MAAPTATPSSSFSLSLRTQTTKQIFHLTKQRSTRICSRPGRLWAVAVQGGSSDWQKAPPGVDTRIHWENEDEGWIGGSGSLNADLEEIKAAYRRLSKEYHPDTTTLPLRTASEKFMKLREIYDVLSNNEKRRFYDWTLAQEEASKEEQKMRIKLKDPYMQEVQNWKPIPDMVDRLGGRNMELSDQAKQALTFDFLIIIFSICCIVYVVFFKEPY